MSEQITRVGVGILIFKDGRVLLGKRRGSHGQGEYAGPGGHVEYMESLTETIIREVKEEAGIEIENIRFNCVINLKSYAPKHYLDIGLLADYKKGEPVNLEPEKNEGWDWYDLENLPGPLFGTTPFYLQALKTGEKFFDA